ncbi:MAG TPA: alpha-amylase family glycosyl hydrolase [Candidatus Limnocylindrales bacterium]|nr:alpha-amylase family glycosyl hydrolase [Candidatus Limnocylindrales bacterium]
MTRRVDPSSPPRDHRAADPPWWASGVVYEIYPRSFQDTNGDGVGDLEGIRRRLDYLSWLGVDAIWIAPFYRSPMADFGYDVADHTDVDPLFGDLAVFDRLLADAHRRGLRVIVDFIPNHTSDRHPWFVESRASRDSKKRDWYVWRDPKPDGSPPNNWISMFGGPAWEWDAATGQYYLHTFLAAQPDLNWRNPAVREAMFDVARFWLDRGVDGFRIDVAQFVMKDPELRDNPPNPEPETLARLGTWAAQLHLYDHGHPDVHEVYRAFRRLVDGHDPGRARVTIGELHHPDYEVWAGYYGDLDEIHLPFNFHLLHAPWEAVRVRAVVEAVEAALPRGAVANWVLGNHDQRRLASRVGPRQARVATMLLLTLRGAPTLYYGDELGTLDGVIPPDRVRDPWERNVPGLGRDPGRTPMAWDGSPNAGFCPPGIEPWLPLAPGWEERNVATEADDPRSLLSLTRRLLELRKRHPALASGSYRGVDGPPGTVCFVRTPPAGPEALVALNLGTEAVRVPLGGRGGRIVLSTECDRTDEPVGPEELVLRADEGCIVER